MQQEKKSSVEHLLLSNSLAGLTMKVSLWAQHLWHMRLHLYHRLSCSISWSRGGVNPQLGGPGINIRISITAVHKNGWFCKVTWRLMIWTDIIYTHFSGDYNRAKNLLNLNAGFHQVLPIPPQFRNNHLEKLGARAWRTWCFKRNSIIK